MKSPKGQKRPPRALVLKARLAQTEAQLAEARARLAELEDTVRAIQAGEVDALVVNAPEGEQIYTLKGAETPYRLLLEAMNEGAVTLSTDGTILYCNNRLAEMAQKPMEQILGANCQHCLSPGQYLDFQKLLKTSKKENGAKGEFLLARGQGNGLPVDISVRSVKFEDAEGFSVLVADISERKAAELALRDANEKLEQRVRERTLKLTEANQNLQARSEELAAANEELQSQGEELEAQANELQARSEELLRANAQLAAANKELEQNSGLLKVAQNKLQTHAAELEKEVAKRTAHLEASNRALETVSYNIAHDLRAPNRTMQGFSELLLTTYGNVLDEEGRGYLQRIAAAASRSDQLLLDLLAFARLGHAPLMCEPRSLEAALMTVLEQFAAEAKQKNASIEVKTPLPEVLANATALEQALSNLINNALKFVPPGIAPQIKIWAEEKVRAEDHRPMVRLCIQDNGVGIPPELHVKAFNVFERLHEGYPGTGIGLAIVKKAVERMEGSVDLKSTPGQGSCFWIELPAIVKN